MMPLAQIAKGMGRRVAGSDRSFDQGRTPEKFAWLESHGFELFPQDGSGITSSDQVLIASAAIEDTVPEVARAKELGCTRMTRAQLLSTLFNEAPQSIAVGGTSGKSTVTAMTAWILYECGRDPTVMNGAVMKNFTDEQNPFASARIGKGGTFISEVDESDGSIALFQPDIAVLLNVSLDHKSMAELRELFGDYCAAAKCAVINFDDEEARALAPRASDFVSFAIRSDDADITTEDGTVEHGRYATIASVRDNRTGDIAALRVPMPGLHNLSNALAAIATARSLGVDLNEAADALPYFSGLARRFDVIGTTASDITVIDDFGHNPEKCAATLRTMRRKPGRIIAFFQPHGYGPLRKTGGELAQTFADELTEGDMTIMCDPVYFGGTTDRSVGTEQVVEAIREKGGTAKHIADRDQCGDYIVGLARPGDRIVVMGARDDTLTEFARRIFERLG